MFNLLLSTGWATREGKMLQAKSLACHYLCQYIIERQLHFGFDKVAPTLKAYDVPMSSNNKKIIATQAMVKLRNLILERYGNIQGTEINTMLNHEAIPL